MVSSLDTSTTIAAITSDLSYLLRADLLHARRQLVNEEDAVHFVHTLAFHLETGNSKRDKDRERQRGGKDTGCGWGARWRILCCCDFKMTSRTHSITQHSMRRRF
ncbi:unnamed protein product [Sphacelaria rigidula]